MSKVDYYDFLNYKLVKSYTGKAYAASNSLTSTEVHFTNNKGVATALCVSRALSEKPSTVKVYTNSSKTSSNTYKCVY